MKDRRRTLLLAALLIVGLATILWLVSEFGPGFLPEEIQSRLLWFGIAIPAAVALLAGFKDILELIDRFRGQPPRPEPNRNGGGDNVQINVQNQSVRLMIRHYSRTATQGVDDSQLQEEMGRYLRWLIDFAGIIKLTGIKRQGEFVVELPLEDVYLPLEAMRARELESQRQGLAGEPAAQAIQLDEIMGLGPRLVITGGPGSGKTTVLLHLALTLGRALAQDDRQMAAQKVGWSGPLPLPLFIPLSRFAAYWRDLDKASVPQADRRRTLAAYISQYLVERQATFNLPDDFFTQLVDAGQPVLLLLDGLDEVPDEATRALVRQAIEDMVTGKERLVVVVTCRTAAYKGRAALGRDFQPVQVLPLTTDHVRDLVTRAYAQLESQDEARRVERTQSLLTGIQNLEEARRARLGAQAKPLVATPLMVRLFLIVHYGGGELPEQRAALYDRAIDSLLHPDYALDENVAEALSRQVGDREYYREVLKHLAFHMQRQGEEQGREISEDELRTTMQSEQELDHLTDRLIQDARTRGTVLEERFETYRFIHLALQEFLAATYLADNMREQEKIARFLEAGPVTESWWREVILLLPGYLHVDAGPLVARQFLQRLARLDPQAGGARLDLASQLSGAELAATAALDLPHLDDRFREELARRLDRLLAQKEALADSPASVRFWAGNALGQLGEVDERLLAVDQMALCFVPAGHFWMGDDEAELEVEDVRPRLHENEVVHDYWIGRYTVTNAQFAAFVRDHGYDDRTLWPEAQAAGVWDNGSITGYYWDDRNKEAVKETKLGPHDYGLSFTLDGQPQVGVCWYEALAFCRWLTRRWRENGILPETWRVILPSETEWEKAARGGLHIPDPPRIVRAAQGLDVASLVSQDNAEPRRIHPWGDSFDGDRANTFESGFGAAGRAGGYPSGASPYGCHEMGGAVWEWTRSLFGRWDPEESGFGELHVYPYVQDAREALDAGYYHARVLRGGSWASTSLWSRCGARLWDFPLSGLNLYGGFRVVLSPLTSEL